MASSLFSSLCCCVVVLLTVLDNVAAVSVEGVKVRAGDTVAYVGSVLEFEPYNEWIEEEGRGRGGEERGGGGGGGRGGGVGGGEGIVIENAKILSEFAAQAKIEGADILVTPEYGLTSIAHLSTVTGDDFNSMLLFAPDPSLRKSPCALNHIGPNFEGLRIISCTAQLNSIYIVVDIAELSPCNDETATHNPFENAVDTAYDCPESGHIYYNTQVVFDREGAVIARYRKKNLYLEPIFLPGIESDETALFVTDFGVRFTLQVCFDIAYEHPGVNNIVTRGVKDVAMSTAWIDILPFYLAPSVQNGWSRELGVNLLVSGYHLPELSKLGSGIYRGFSDLAHSYTFDPDSGNKLVVSEVETIASVDGVTRRNVPSTEGLATGEEINRISDDSRSSGLSGAEGSDLSGVHVKVEESEEKVVVGRNEERKDAKRAHTIFYDNITNYSHLLLQPTSGEVHTVELCHEEEICCSLSYVSTSNLNYSLLAYSGIMYLGNGAFSQYIEVCAIVWCQNEDVNTCTNISSGLPPSDHFGNFNISGNFNSPNVFPVLFTRNLTILDNDGYSVSVSEDIRTMSRVEETPNLLSAGFLGRWYDRDPSAETPAAGFVDSALEYLVSVVVSVMNFFNELTE